MSGERGSRTRASGTIHVAIREVLAEAERPLTAEEVHDRIVARGLYTFQAQDPVHVVYSTLRRHCMNLDFPSARPEKYFELTNGAYRLLQNPGSREPSAFTLMGQGRNRGQTVVTVPPEEFEESDCGPDDGPGHTEMQFRLLQVGSSMGLSLWAPINDRGRMWDGRLIGDIRGLVSELPPQFDAGAMKTVSYIDVIWMEKQAIVAAFEIEHTSAVYSGLLRMADLMTLVPNQEIRWFIVAPDSRFAKFAFQIGRPTFANLRKPLHTVCKFLPYTRLVERLDQAFQFLPHMRPGFVDDLAQSYDPREATDFEYEATVH